ncbi:MAG: hypothetical protein ABRQ38_03325 [Candidatus Eremiobacterota bacterium]
METKISFIAKGCSLIADKELPVIRGQINPAMYVNAVSLEVSLLFIIIFYMKNTI